MELITLFPVTNPRDGLMIQKGPIQILSWEPGPEAGRLLLDCEF